MGGDFFERVWDIVRQIPPGKVTTYGHIARLLGTGAAARTVGWALNAAAGRADVPAHRVVNRRGELTGRMHFATPTLMRELLEAEGVTFEDNRVRLDKHLWIPPNPQMVQKSGRLRADVCRAEPRPAQQYLSEASSPDRPPNRADQRW